MSSFILLIFLWKIDINECSVSENTNFTELNGFSYNFEHLIYFNEVNELFSNEFFHKLSCNRLNFYLKFLCDMEKNLHLKYSTQYTLRKRIRRFYFLLQSNGILPKISILLKNSELFGQTEFCRKSVQKNRILLKIFGKCHLIEVKNRIAELIFCRIRNRLNYATFEPSVLFQIFSFLFMIK